MSLFTFMWVSTFVLSGIFSGGETANLTFYHGSLTNYTTTPLEESLKLLPLFNRNLKSVFFIFGYTETADSEDVTLILSAYLKTGYTNAVLVDWAKEARSTWAGEVLSYVFSAAPNTKLVGRDLGKALTTLIENGISEDKIHLVGHSLGAHVAGYAGDFVKESGLNGRKLNRITGLDPAGPFFQPAITGGLTSSAAKFVDVLHTNPGQYGISQSIGTVDIWANCESSIQPGCPNLIQALAGSDSFCSHHRSYLIFYEAILSPNAFPAVKANNCASWRSQRTSAQIIYLGDMIDTSARGNYYFSTRSQAPFSKGRAGLVPNN